MVLLFFYKNLTNTELIKKININFEIMDGYVTIQKYDTENNILEISDNKIVKFNMKINDIITKINEIEECKIKNTDTKYILSTIYVNKIFGGSCEAYILY